ncbi:unnamed protein product [Heligmosomoides polygyrus]|uniref:Uncharacterized protein n=1 Tax=Heligmosomoides polygyrus TaxID=6339 RepID=A0A3P7X6G5_HELPZ|nr:unnamed protein product [Heligmosomoides polygyrus]
MLLILTFAFSASIPFTHPLVTRRWESTLRFGGARFHTASKTSQIRKQLLEARQQASSSMNRGSATLPNSLEFVLTPSQRPISGPPLTEIIDTFVSVAGANHGSALCVVPIPIGTCNRRTGLHCDSVFLQDINNQARYEATYIFSIFSSADEKIGFRSCGKPVSPIKGGTGYVMKSGLNHDQVMDTTHHLQMNFFTKHAPK